MTAPNSITVTSEQLISAALQEIGAQSPGEPVSNDDNPWVLQKLQRVIDNFNARLPMIYNVNFSTFTLVANLAPHTIGPTGTFAVNQRPIDIPSISLILNNTSPSQVEIPLNRRDQDWWAAQNVKNLKSAIPTDYYYSQDWPNGQIYFWPVPSAVNNVLIQSRQVLAEITSYVQAFTMPPGYWDAVVYSLAVALGPSYEKPISADLRSLMNEAIRAVQSNNIQSPRGSTADAGMPGVGGRGGWNYYSNEER